MRKYRFVDGHEVTTKLSLDEMLKRMNRLDWLRVLTEGYEDGEGKSICDKALRAYNKTENFTGIIRLTAIEKDFLGYRLEDSMNTEKDIETIQYYLKCGGKVI